MRELWWKERCWRIFLFTDSQGMVVDTEVSTEVDGYSKQDRKEYDIWIKVRKQTRHGFQREQEEKSISRKTPKESEREEQVNKFSYSDVLITVIRKDKAKLKSRIRLARETFTNCLFNNTAMMRIASLSIWGSSRTVFNYFLIFLFKGRNCWIKEYYS